MPIMIQFGCKHNNLKRPGVKQMRNSLFFDTTAVSGVFFKPKISLHPPPKCKKYRSFSWCHNWCRVPSLSGDAPSEVQPRLRTVRGCRCNGAWGSLGMVIFSYRNMRRVFLHLLDSQDQKVRLEVCLEEALEIRVQFGTLRIGIDNRRLPILKFDVRGPNHAEFSSGLQMKLICQLGFILAAMHLGSDGPWFRLQTGLLSLRKSHHNLQMFEWTSNFMWSYSS